MSGSEGPSSDALIDATVRQTQEYDPAIAEILVGNLKSDLPAELKKDLFGLANSRVFLSKIDTGSNDKRIIWELVKLAELDYITSLPKEKFTVELDSIFQQLIFEVMLGLNLSDDGLGFKGFSEGFNFNEIHSTGREGGMDKKPGLLSPRRWIK